MLTPQSTIWVERLLWIAAGVTTAMSVGDAVVHRSGAMRLTSAIVVWSVFGLVVLAVMVPSALGLTVVRTAAPLAVVGAVSSWIGGASPVVGAAAVGLAAVHTAFALSADVGGAFVQASAYGNERRFLLRAPFAYLVPLVVSWLVWCALLVAAVLVLGASRWLVGGLLGAAALVLGRFVITRYHRLSRRWLVIVPAGVVVHDHLVLGETTMVTRSNVLAMRLALADTVAADFTGPASGHAIEVEVREMITALLAPTRRAPRGTALHVQAFIIAPSRPGLALTYATEQRLPVG